MAMDQADLVLVRELASIIVEFALRAEREHPEVGPRDDQLTALLSRADLALWATYERLEPIAY